MKKLFFLAFAFFLSSAVFSASIDEFVFFGDSLTDNGKLYSLINIPHSPPYYNGRFSNGPTWAEILGQYYQDKRAIPYNIYAIGGASTFIHESDSLFVFTLDNELLEYYAQSLMADRSKKLYVIWIGANDYLKETLNPDKLPSTQEIEQLSTKVIDYIRDAMNSLKGKGAQYFLILNLPDLGKTPHAAEKGLKEILHLMTSLHNQKLIQAVNDFKKANPELRVIFLDINELFDDLLLHPEKYNQKYQTDLHILDQACWPGGFSLNKRLSRDLHHLEWTDKMTPLFNSPALDEAYRVGLMKDSLEACKQPDQFVFWDRTHPTEALHKILSAVSVETLEIQAKDLLTG